MASSILSKIIKAGSTRGRILAGRDLIKNKLLDFRKDARFLYKRTLYDVGFKRAARITLEDFNQQRMPLKLSQMNVNPKTIDAANRLQEAMGRRLYITSGYRSPEYTKQLLARGYSPELKSTHLGFRPGGSVAFDVNWAKTGAPRESIAARARELGLNVEDLKLTPSHVHAELPVPDSPTKLMTKSQENMVKSYAKRIKNQSKQTAGLVQSMDKNKVNHQIMDINTKNNHLFGGKLK